MGVGPAGYPRETFSQEEASPRTELSWIGYIKELDAALHRRTLPRYQLPSGGTAYVWQQARDHLTERIDAGEFDRWLPTRKALAQQYGVGIGTIDHAIHELAVQGRVTILRGKGTAIS